MCRGRTRTVRLRRRAVDRTCACGGAAACRFHHRAHSPPCPAPVQDRGERFTAAVQKPPTAARA